MRVPQTVSEMCARPGFRRLNTAAGRDGELAVQVAHLVVLGRLEGMHPEAEGTPRFEWGGLHVTLAAQWVAATTAARSAARADADEVVASRATVEQLAAVLQEWVGQHGASERRETNLAAPSPSAAGFLLRFHTGFAAVAALALGPALRREPLYAAGPAVCGLVACWHLGIWAATRAATPGRGGGVSPRAELRRQWRFVSALSLFQVVPDWFLSSVLRTLRFPDDGAWKVGGVVSVYMSGMWAPPLLWVLACCSDGRAAAPAATSPSALAAAAALALFVFGAAEVLLSAGLLPLQLWHCTGPPAVELDVVGAALYVLPAEAVLGAATLQAYHATAHLEGWGGAARRVLAAAAVATLYTGALSVSYLFVEKGARPWAA